MSCETCSGLRLELDSRERQFEELRSKFAKQKLQSKAKVAQVRHELAKLAEDGGPDSNASLLMRLEEANDRLRRFETEADDLRAQLLAKDTQIADHVIRIKILEQQTTAPSKNADSVETPNNVPSRAPKIEKNNDADVQKILAQLVYKDTRILELNNTILDKDRQVLDLQELCREQREVAHSKAMAVQILQDRIKQFEMRETKESATETSELFISTSTRGDLPPFYNGFPSTSSDAKVTSPGRAIVVISPGHERGSPPPVDPSEDRSSVTTDTGLGATGAGVVPDLVDFRDRTPPPADKKADKKNKKKRVTFDLTPQNENADGASRRVRELEDQLQNAEATLIDLTGENDELRTTIAELESLLAHDQHSEDAAASSAKLHDAQIEQLHKELDEAKRDGKNQILKAKAAAQSRIKDLEERMATIESDHREETDRLHADVETVESARSWALEENARLIEELNGYKTKYTSLREDNDVLNAENAQQKESLSAQEKVIEELSDDLIAAQRTADALLEQKQAVLDDVDRLKEALEAQEELIETLDGDVEVYQQQIEMLRDSLGELKGQREEANRAETSRVETRNRLKGKAYETKLRALEQEKEQLNRESTSHKLKSKAFDAKIRSIEKRNSELQRSAEDATAECDSLRAELEAAQKEVAQLTADAQTKAAENESLRARLDEINASYESGEKSVQVLTDEKAEIETELQGLWERERKLKAQLADGEQTQRQLQKERADFRAQCKELIQSETALTEKLTSLVDEHDKLRAEHAKLKDRSDVLESGATSECRHLADELQKLRGHFESIERERLSLEQEVAHLRVANADLTDDVKTSRAQFTAGQTSAEETIAQLTAAVDKWRRACENEQAAVADLQATNALLRTQFDDKCGEVERLTVALEEWRTACANEQAAVADLQANNALLRTQFDDKCGEVEKLTVVVGEWRTACEKEQAAVADLQATNALLRSQLDDKCGEVEKLTVALEEWRTACEKEQAAVADAQAANALLRSQLDDKCGEVDALKAGGDELRAQLENLGRYAEQLRTAVDHASNSGAGNADAVAVLTQQLGDARIRDDALLAHIAVLEAHLTEKARQTDDAHASLQQTAAQLEEAKNSLAQLQQRLDGNSGVERAYAELQAQLNVVNAAKAAAENASADANAQLHAKHDEIAFLRNELQQVSDARMAAENTVHAVREDLRIKEEEIAYLRREVIQQTHSQKAVSDREEQSVKVEEAMQQRSAGDAALTELQQILTECQSQLVVVSQQKVAAEEVVQSKNDEIAFLRNELEQVIDAKAAAEKTAKAVRDDLRIKEEEIAFLRREVVKDSSQKEVDGWEEQSFEVGESTQQRPADDAALSDLQSQLVTISQQKVVAEEVVQAKDDEIAFLQNELEQVNDAKVAGEKTMIALRDDLRVKEEELAFLRREVVQQAHSQNAADGWDDQSFEVGESTQQRPADDAALTELQSQLVAVSQQKVAAEKVVQSKDDEIAFLQNELEQVNDAKVAAEKTTLALRDDLRIKEEELAFLRREVVQNSSQDTGDGWDDPSFEVGEPTQQRPADDAAVVELTQTLTECQSQLVTVSQQKEAAEKAVQSKDDEITFLQTELEQVNDAKVAAEKTVLAVRNDLRAKEEEVVLLRSELDQVHSRHTSIERRSPSKTHESEQHQQQQSASTTTIAELQRSLAEVESQLVVALEEKAAAEKLLQSKDEEVTFLREELEQSKAENDEVEQWGRSETHELESQLSTVTGTVTELRATIDAKERDLHAAKDQLRKIKAAAKALQQERENHRGELAARDEKLSALSNLLNEKSAELAMTMDHNAAILSEHQSTINALRSRAEDLENNLALKESRVAQLQVELNGASRRFQDETHRRAEVAAVEPGDLQGHLDLAEEQLATVKRDLQTAADERDKLAKDRQSLCQEIMDLNDRAAKTDGQLEAQSIVIDGLNQSIEALITENEELKNSLSAAESHQVVELQSVQHVQKTDSDAMHDDSRSYDPDQITAMQRKTTSLEEENQLLRQCLNEAKQAGLENADRVFELEALTASQQTAVDSLKAEVWALESKLEEAVKARDAALRSLELVQADLAVATDELNGAKEMERELNQSLDVKNRELAARQDELEGQMRLVERARQSLGSAENELNVAQLERNRLVEETDALREELTQARAVEQQHADVVGQKTQLEGAYQELATYYSQLQVAYSAIYQKMEDVGKTERTDAETGTDEAGEDVEALMSVVDELKTQLTALESELIAAENDNRMQKSRCHSLHNALQSVKAEVAAFNIFFVAEKANLLDSVGQLGLAVVEPLTRVQQKATTVLEAVKRQDDAVSDLQTRLRDSEAAVVRLQSSLADSEQAGEESRTKFEAQLRDSLDEMQRVGELTASMQQRITEAEEQIASLNESLSVAAHEAQEMQLAHERQSADRNALQEQLTEAHNTVESLTASLEIALQKVALAETEAVSRLQEMTADLTTRTADNDGLFRANAELARNGKEVQDQLDLLTERLQVLSEENDALLRANAELSKTSKEAQEQLNLLTERVRVLSEENETLSRTNAELSRAGKEAQEQVDLHTERLQVLSEENETLSRTNAELSKTGKDVQDQLNQLTERLRVHSEEKDSLARTNAELSSTGKDVQDQLSLLTERVRVLSEENASLTAQLEREKAAANTENQRLVGDVQTTVDDLTAEKAALNKKYATLEDEKRVLEETLATLTARLAAAESQQRQTAELLVNVTSSPPSTSPPHSNQSTASSISQQRRTTMVETEVVLTRSNASVKLDSTERRVRMSCSPTEHDAPSSSWGSGAVSPVYGLQRCESAPDGGNISLMQMLDDESLSRMELFKSLEVAKKSCRELACENRDLKLQLRGMGGLSAIGDPETNRLKRRVAQLEQNAANYQALIFMKDELVAKIREMEANCDRISEERKELLATVAEIQQRLTTTETEKQNIHESLSSQVRVLESRCTELTYERTEMETKYERVRTELEHDRGGAIAEEKGEQSTTEHAARVHKLEAQLTMVKNILDGSRTQLTESENRVRLLESQHAEKLAEVDALKSEISTLQAAIEDAASEKTELIATVDQFRLAVQDRSADADQQEAELRNEICSHASASDNLKQENIRLTNDLSEARQFAETVHAQLRAQVDERNACHQLLEQSRACVAELEARLEQEVDARSQIQTQLGEKCDAFEALTQRVAADDSSDRLQSVSVERDELSDALGKATADNEVLGDQCTQMQTLVANAEHVAQQLRVELDTAIQTQQALTEQLTAATEECSTFKTAVVQYNEAIQQLEGRLRTELAARDDLETRLKETTAAYGNLQQHVAADDSSDRLRSVIAERDELSDALEKATADNEVLSAQCTQMQTLVANAEHVAQELRVELDTAINNQRALTDQLAAATEECSTSKAVVVQNNEAIQQLEGQLKKEHAARDDLEIKLKETTAAYGNLQQHVAADDSSDRLKTMTIERDELKAALDNATAELNRLTEQLNSLTEQHSTLQSEAQSWQRSAHETTNAFEALRREMDSMNAVQSEQHRQSSNIKEEYDRLNGAQQAMEESNRQLSEERRRLAEDNERLANNSASQALYLEETQQTIVVCQRQLNDVSKKAAQLETKCAQLLSERAEILDSATTENHKIIAILKEKERLTEELSDQLRDIRAQCERLTTENAQFNSNASRLQQELNEKCEETTALTQRLQSNSESVAKQQKHHEDLMQELLQKDNELSEFSERSTQQLAELENEKEQLTARVADIESQLLQTSREAAENVEQLNAQIVHANKVAEECRADLTAAEERCSQLTIENAEHSTIIDRLNNDVSRLTTELEQSTVRMGGDHEQLLLRTNEYSTEIEHLKSDLAALQSTADQAAADNAKLLSTIEQIESAPKEEDDKHNQRITELERINDELSTKLSQSVSEQQQLDAALELARQSAHDSSSKVESLNNELSLLRANLADAISEKESAEEKLAQASLLDHSGVVERRVQLDNNASITKHLEIENVRLEEELFDAHTQLEQMTGEADELGKALQHAEASL
uniref:Uncharacterized protein n=1 Tax=Plectus sambesii TaxID=2011161 RepID=A0A914W8G9_9BILA